MPVINSTARASTGRDVSLVLISAFGRVDMPNITGFKSKQETANLKSDRLDGVQLRAELPKGWSGSFDMERGSNALDKVVAQSEAAWFATGTYTTGLLYQYIMEADGSTSTYMFDNVSFKLDDAGEYAGDKFVKQTVSFEAGQRIAK